MKHKDLKSLIKAEKSHNQNSKKDNSICYTINYQISV